MEKNKPNRKQTANHIVMQISRAVNTAQLDILSISLESEYQQGHLYSYDYERLSGYINHRRILVKQPDGDIVEVGSCQALVSNLNYIKNNFYSYQKHSSNEYRVGIPLCDLFITLPDEQFKSDFRIIENFNTVVGGENAAAND